MMISYDDDDADYWLWNSDHQVIQMEDNNQKEPVNDCYLFYK